jgi:phosphate transport system substrate-binding protein
MKFVKTSTLVALSMGALVSTSAFARDNVQIAGSSTVLPFASIVAEQFGQSFSQFKTPVVGSGGSSGGIRQFCQGVGANTIDIANASRPIRSGEVKACADKGVTKIIEVKFGYDGIVFSSRRDSNSFALTQRHIYMATAAKVPHNGKVVDNPFTTWNQIDPKLPNQRILLAIPASNHGTREVFEESGMIVGCKDLPEIKALDKKEANNVCIAVRKDGRVIEIAGDYTEALARLNADKDAVGVFGLSFYESNRDRLQVATVAGVTPSLQTIESGKYPISRPLFFYIKDAHVGVIPGVLEYARFFLSPGVSGMGSPLEKAGLVPLNDKERAEVLSAIQNRKSL